MANCPNCGSDHIQLKRDSNVNWGRAVAGWALFGVVGGAVGATTGENRESNAYLNCGTSWKAQDLYKMLEVVKKTANIKIDLSQDSHREFLKDFIETIGPYLEQLKISEKKAEKEVSQVKAKSDEYAFQGCSWGCIGSIGFIIAIAGAISSGLILLLIVILPVLGLLWGTKLDKARKPKIEESVSKIQKESFAEKEALENEIQQKLNGFMFQYPHMY